MFGVPSKKMCNVAKSGRRSRCDSNKSTQRANKVSPVEGLWDCRSYFIILPGRQKKCCCGKEFFFYIPHIRVLAMQVTTVDGLFCLQCGGGTSYDTQTRRCRQCPNPTQRFGELWDSLNSNIMLNDPPLFSC